MCDGWSHDFNPENVSQIVKNGIEANNRAWHEALQKWLEERKQHMRDEIERLKAENNSMISQAALAKIPPPTNISKCWFCPCYHEEIQKAEK